MSQVNFVSVHCKIIKTIKVDEIIWNLDRSGSVIHETDPNSNETDPQYSLKPVS